MSNGIKYDPAIEWSIGVHRNEAGEPLFVHGDRVVGTVDDIRGILARYDEHSGTASPLEHTQKSLIRIMDAVQAGHDILETRISLVESILSNRA